MACAASERVAQPFSPCHSRASGNPATDHVSVGQGSLEKRVESPSEGLRHFRDSLAPSVKKSPLGLRQKIFRPPTPLVAVLPQGLMVLLEVGNQGFQGVEFGLDNAQTREE